MLRGWGVAMRCRLAVNDWNMGSNDSAKLVLDFALCPSLTRAYCGPSQIPMNAAIEFREVKYICL